MREGRDGREADAKEESAVRKVEGRRGGSGGGSSGEEGGFEKKVEGRSVSEYLGINGKTLFRAHSLKSYIASSE